MPDLGVGSLSGPLQVLAGKPATSTGTTLLTAFATNVKVLATSSGGLLALDPGQSFGGIFLPTPLVMGETTPPTTASNLSAMWFDSVAVKLKWVCGATTANAMTLDASGNVNVAGTYQIAGTSLFATASAWSALQTYSAGLTVSAGVLTVGTSTITLSGNNLTIATGGGGSLTLSGSPINFGTKFTVSAGTGTFTLYKGIGTVGGGIAAEYAGTTITPVLLGTTATTITTYTPTATGQFAVTVGVTCSVASTPVITVTFTDATTAATATETFSPGALTAGQHVSHTFLVCATTASAILVSGTDSLASDCAASGTVLAL